MTFSIQRSAAAAKKSAGLIYVPAAAAFDRLPDVFSGDGTPGKRMFPAQPTRNSAKIQEKKIVTQS